MHILRKISKPSPRLRLHTGLLAIMLSVYCVNQDRTNVNDGCYGDNTRASKYDFNCTKTTAYSANARKIFVTTATYNGNLGGVSGANTKCNSDAGRPDMTKQYAAYILPGSGYLSDTYGYYSVANLKIGSVIAGSFQYPLENPIATISTQVWTGANSTDCSVWTIGNNGSNGTYGVANATGNSYFNSLDDTCDKLKSLYCLEK
jgi:hypothetical protein